MGVVFWRGTWVWVWVGVGLGGGCGWVSFFLCTHPFTTSPIEAITRHKDTSPSIRSFSLIPRSRVSLSLSLSVAVPPRSVSCWPRPVHHPNINKRHLPFWCLFCLSSLLFAFSLSLSHLHGLHNILETLSLLKSSPVSSF